MWESARNNAINNDLMAIPAKIFVPHYRNLTSIKYDNWKAPIVDKDDIQCYWYWGCSGAGKSTTAREIDFVDYGKPYLKEPNQWWDHYNNEKYVLIEDFDLDNKSFCRSLKILADKWAFPGQIKGGTIKEIRPTLVVITSNYHPGQIWTTANDLQPIMRRFKVVHFRKLGLAPSETTDVKLVNNEVRAAYAPGFRPAAIRSANATITDDENLHHAPWSPIAETQSLYEAQQPDKIIYETDLDESTIII